MKKICMLAMAAFLFTGAAFAHEGGGKKKTTKKACCKKGGTCKKDKSKTAEM
ncbi:MAG: hypothetical protein ABI834_01345 [Ginsengibacter sp.]